MMESLATTLAALNGRSTLCSNRSCSEGSWACGKTAGQRAALTAWTPLRYNLPSDKKILIPERAETL